MSKNNNSSEKTSQRRVYVLPNELVERIIDYQKSMGLASEVEAVRKLLDSELKRQDDWHSLVLRISDDLKQNKSLSDVIKVHLVDHPLVKQISKDQKSFTFHLVTDERVSVFPDGKFKAFSVTGRPLDKSASA